MLLTKSVVVKCMCLFGLFCVIKLTNGQSVISTGHVQLISIETANAATVLKVDQDQLLHMVYFGKRLKEKSEYDRVLDVYHQPTDYSGVADAAYPTAGSRNLFEPALAVTHFDGNNSLVLKFVSSRTSKIAADVSLTEILLRDSVYDFSVKLFYKAYYNEDVVEVWSRILHNEKGAVILHKFASASFYLRGRKFWLTHFHGDWAKEMQPECSEITHGIKTLDSKLGTRADLFQAPVFMVSMDKPAAEDEGAVMLGSVEWSGNFKVDLELDNRNNLRITSGINNYQSEFQLQPGEAFTSAKLLYTFSDNGTGQASRQLQSWARDFRLADGRGDRLTLLNNWESTYFDFNEKKLKGLLKDTKSLGANLFLLDDGWFGNKYPRNGDHAGLGDWQENRQKLPDGIVSLTRAAQKEGVKFGIWVEPEMVNPKSELYERHPDWVIKQSKRPEYYFRNQLVLDLSNPRVQDFVFGIVDSLMIKNSGLAYIKWDCNAVIYNANSLYLKDQAKLYIAYVEGLYRVLARIKAKYPRLPMMLCSGGGGRVDYGALAFFTEYWPSDNTDPLERIFIQWANSYFYPAIASVNHVTNWGKQPLKFKIDVAMMGKLGFDIPLHELKENDLDFCKAAVKTYNQINPIIFHGQQYRLQNPWDNDVASIMYVDSLKKKAIVMSYLVTNRYDAGSYLPVKLKGLDANARYEIKEINLYPGAKSNLEAGAVYTGDFLMSVGLNPEVNADRSSVLIELQSVGSSINPNPNK